jgi:hypothetical protein
VVTAVRAAALPEWVAPTVRACRPALLAVAAVVAVHIGVAVAAGAGDVALPRVHVWLMLAALAGAAAAPHDPAATLLAALPTGPGRRLAHRVGTCTLAAVVAWMLGGRVVDAAVAGPHAGAAGSVPALLALVAIAVAVGSRAGTWGALAPLALVAAGRLVEGPDLLTDALALWWTHPWIVVAIVLCTRPCRARPGYPG